MDGCKPNPGSDSTAEIQNEDGVKDVNDIILTLNPSSKEINEGVIRYSVICYQKQIFSSIAECPHLYQTVVSK